jgi:acetyl esterase/lipase
MGRTGGRPRPGGVSSQQRAVRALLVVALVPLAVVLGVLASAVLGSGGARTPPGVSRGVMTTPPAAMPLPEEPAVTVAPPPAAPRAVPQAPPAGAAAPAARPAAAAPRAAAAPPSAAPAPAPPPAVEPSAAYAPPGTERIDVGVGPQGAAIFRSPTPAARPGPVVIFLHGWVAIDPARYGPWIGHLVRHGATVIYPAYQSKPAYDTITPLANLLAGVRAALEHVRVASGRLVVAGHSAGGALAVDYAAVALANALPVPAAVFSVYPGRKLRHLAVPIPAVNPIMVAPDTRVLAYAGERDTAVGSGTATRIVASVPQADATLRIIRDDAVDDHSAPRRFDSAARRTFWEPLDELVAATAEPAATARLTRARASAPMGAP